MIPLPQDDSYEIEDAGGNMKRKNLMLPIFLAISLTTTLTYGLAPKIKIDNVLIQTDSGTEIKKSRIMVPLRVVSENLGASVDWKDNKVTISKEDSQIILYVGNDIAVKNKEGKRIDAKPYIKNKRMMVPLRFIAETFECQVDYKDSVVNISTVPLTIEGETVESLYYEYHMTMGGKIQEIKGNSYIDNIYNILISNKGEEKAAPVVYKWNPDNDTPGSYYKISQFNFKGVAGKDIKQLDIYGLVDDFQDIEVYPRTLLHDATGNKWYFFERKAIDSIINSIEKAKENGYVKLISDTIV